MVVVLIYNLFLQKAIMKNINLILIICVNQYLLFLLHHSAGFLETVEI